MEDDKAYPIPERFRASADLTDEKAYELLKANDLAQKTLSEQVQSPFTRSSPRDLYRRKAKVTIETLLKFQPWSDEQIEMMANAYSQIGRYDLAAEISKVNSEHYARIWDAVFRETIQECPHGKQYVSDYIWSIKEGTELPLLRCNIAGCDVMNVMEKPPEMVAASRQRAQHFGKTANMTISQIQQYHQTNVKQKSG